MNAAVNHRLPSFRAAAGAALVALAVLPVGVTTETTREARAARATAVPALPEAPQASATSASRPSLLVIVVVDQMRADYLTRYGARFTSGLRRLLDDGAVFDEARYPYLNTVTCAGHATIGTGALPATHGAILNQWYDRAIGRVRTCTDDPSVATYTYGLPERSRGHSAAALRVPTLGDRLRSASPESRVVTMSMKARSALMLAGQKATAATWLGDHNFDSTDALGPPNPRVAAYVAANPIGAYRGEVWERLLPEDTYTGPDAGIGERPDPGWTSLFPHPLAGRSPDQYLHLWEESPWSDAYLGRFAEAAIRDFELGQRDAVDLLGVSFSATDLVGHSFGPDSHEVQDTLLRLDRTLGSLLATLDRLVGRDRYVLALSADHGVARIPEAATAAGTTAGRVPLGLVRSTVDAALSALGPGPHVARVEYTQIYLTPETAARATAVTLAPAITALQAMPGVKAALWNRALDRAVPGVDETTLAAVRASHDAERSGDLMIVPREHFFFVVGSRADGGDATTHGTLHTYDQHVPLIFLGRPFAAAHHDRRVTPADLAPTLADTIALPMPGVEGRSLLEDTTRPRPGRPRP